MIHRPRLCFAVRLSMHVVFLIPLRKIVQSFTDSDLRTEAVIPFKGAGIGISQRNISLLHPDQLPVTLKLIRVGENACSDQFLLQCGDKIKKVFRLTAADVVDRIRRDGESVSTCGS